MKHNPRIVLIHATPLSQGIINLTFKRDMPDAEIVNILDDSLAKDRAKIKALDAAMDARFMSLVQYAHTINADCVLFTCSAFGTCIEKASPHFNFPVLKPNEAMFEEALARGKNIAMISTFAPSIATMVDEFNEAAAALNPQASLTPYFVDHAMEAFANGDEEKHHQLVAEQAAKIKADAIMLGQFSIANAYEKAQQSTIIPLLSSPDCAVRKIKRILKGETK